MEGEGLLSQRAKTAGIVPRVAEEIFAAAASSESAAKELTVKLSVVEVYQEKIRDLFDPSQDNLQLYDDPVEGTIVAGVTEVQVTNLAEHLHLLQVSPMPLPGEFRLRFQPSCPGILSGRRAPFDDVTLGVFTCRLPWRIALWGARVSVPSISKRSSKPACASPWVCHHVETMISNGTLAFFAEMNTKSSRSHCVYTVTITGRDEATGK